MKDVIIVHDLIPFYYNKHFPGVLNRVQNAYVMLRMKSSIRTADKIITISEYSKQDIERAFQEAREHSGQPTAIIAKTVKGKGVLKMLFILLR